MCPSLLPHNFGLWWHTICQSQWRGEMCGCAVAYMFLFLVLLRSHLRQPFSHLRIPSPSSIHTSLHTSFLTLTTSTCTSTTNIRITSQCLQRTRPWTLCAHRHSPTPATRSVSKVRMNRLYPPQPTLAPPRLARSLFSLSLVSQPAPSHR